MASTCGGCAQRHRLHGGRPQRGDDGSGGGDPGGPRSCGGRCGGAVLHARGRTDGDGDGDGGRRAAEAAAQQPF